MSMYMYDSDYDLEDVNSNDKSSHCSDVDLNTIHTLSKSILKELTTTPFACGGSIGLVKESDSVQIRYGPDGQGSLLSLPLKSIDLEPINKLLSACAPVTFGKGGEDVLDETYRKASKLDVTEFLTDFCPYQLGIVDVISQMLLPNIDEGPRGVDAELYKLNIYSGPSGKFKPHVDTPRGDGQFGSLVVCLPLSHVGGELVVRHAGKELVFDWSSNRSHVGDPATPMEVEEQVSKKAKLDTFGTPQDASPKIYWAAFYSDCEHEVLELTSGHRLTLTYNLFVTQLAAGKYAGLASSPLDPTQLSFYKELKAALLNKDFFAEGHVLATGLSHAYAHTSKRLQMIPTALKGHDMHLFEACRALGLQCFFRPVIEHECGQYERNRAFVGRDLRFATLGDGEIEHFESEVKGMWGGTKLHKCNVIWLKEGLGKWSEPGLSYVAYGNQAEQDVKYSHAVMFIVVPPYGERMAGNRKHGDGRLSPLLQKSDGCICEKRSP